ncbi:hypothetical protein DFP72DRAFT_559030 [Ephemerocybe angulata]|uniref:Uncharacterized protein n=1 Tax=Ephemerocybe angulata TaxID=980116 RepID=A0A8H6IBK7_9AGAR|nr:hypothetical protein DFP72DRAFT_559030 [Tulosesus angulatus]
MAQLSRILPPYATSSHAPFPREIWRAIIDFVFFDDPNGATLRSASEASRALRDLTYAHRHQSVILDGWEKLLSFEAYFCTLPTKQRRLVNLYVHLPEMYLDAYPKGRQATLEDPDNADWDDPSVYVGEDSDGEESEDGDVEFSSISKEEQAELAQEVEDLNEDAQDYSGYHGQDLSQLALDQSVLGRLEYKVFSALRRLLEASATTLSVLTLCWCRSSHIYTEAVIPVLPNLRSLAIHTMYGKYKANSTAPLHRSIATPVLFPSLERLRIHSDVPHMDDDFKVLTAPPLRFISASTSTYLQLVSLPETLEEVQVWAWDVKVDLRMFKSAPQDYDSKHLGKRLHRMKQETLLQKFKAFRTGNEKDAWDQRDASVFLLERFNPGSLTVQGFKRYWLEQLTFEEPE